MARGSRGGWELGGGKRLQDDQNFGEAAKKFGGGKNLWWYRGTGDGTSDILLKHIKYPTNTRCKMRSHQSEIFHAFHF